MPKPASSTSRFDSAQDPSTGRGLRLLAAALAFIMLLIAGGSALGQESEDASEPTSPAARQVKSQLADLGDDRVGEALRAFYTERDYEPAWFKRGKTVRTRLAQNLLGTLEAAHDQGLDPADYRVEELRSAIRQPGGDDRRTSPEEVAELEVALSQAFVTYTDHMVHGRLSPTQVDGEWYLKPREEPLEPFLASAVARRNGPQRTAQRMEPKNPDYRRLKNALSRYRQLADDGGWPEVPDGAVVEAGEALDEARYSALVERLRAQGFLSERAAEERSARLARWNATRDQPTAEGGEDGSAAPEELTFDEEMAAALQRFQDVHGIKEDGVLGPNSLRELNVPAEERARLIALNLERWRWMPDSLGERYIEVNLPGFTLEAVENGRATLAMPVVIGKDGWETPVLTESMEHAVVNPYWNIPESILREDILPKLRQNPSYLAAQNMEVVDLNSGAVVNVGVEGLESGAYRVRQKPGRDNALGTIKFIFPNRHNVYLHDTPAEHAFDRTYRDLSHGCVRVERPLDLADWVFEEYTVADVDSMIDAKDRRTLPLDRELPVYFLYWTAFVDGDGQVQFRPDVYGYDAKHGEALEARRRAS